MKILITGVDGVIGSKLIGSLTNKGHEVFGCDLQHSRFEHHRRCDITQFRQLESVVAWSQPDCVFHLAAEFGRWNGEEFFEQLWASNVIGTRNVLELQRRHGFKLLFASSSEVYGDYEGLMNESVMNEFEIKQLNDYACTKWVNELQINNFQMMFGTNSMIFRIFNTYGPGEYYSEYRSVICRFAYCAVHKIPFTVYRRHYRTHTYIDDAVEMIACLLDHFEDGGVINVAGSHRTTIEELASIIVKQAGLSEDFPIFKNAEPFTTTDKKVDNARILAIMGDFEETSFEDGLAATLDWMKKTYL